MRVVVVGASGNVGTALLRHIRLTPEIDEVVGVVRRPPGPDAGAPYDTVHWVACDIGTGAAPQVLAETFRGADAVVHLAWQIQPTHDQAQLARTNVVGSRNVFRAAVDAGVDKIVYASSVGAYAPGPKDRFVDESWPTTGVPGSSYSRHKALVERLLDDLEQERPDLRVVRMRPGLIFQRDAGGQIARYFLGPWVPVGLLRWQRVPLVPRHPRLRAQCVHADDVADAYSRAILADVRGPFNVATGPVLDGELLARALHGRTVPVPPSVLGTAAGLTWRARLQPIDPGWIRLAAAVPLLDHGRITAALGWMPHHDAESALRDLLAGMAGGTGTASSALRPRASVPARLGAVLQGRLPGHGARY